MSNQEFLSSSKKWDWVTPTEFWDKISPIFNFTLDVAADMESTKCDMYITEEMDALTMDWVVHRGDHWWLNPPWGKAYEKESKERGLNYRMHNWMRHALKQYEKGYEGVSIVSVRTDTKWWQNNIKYAPWLLFPRGRVHFVDPITGIQGKQTTFPSVLVIWIKHLSSIQISLLRVIGDLRKRV